MTAPSAASLKMPLAKLAKACLPKIRLAPAAGDILLNFGLSCSPDHTKRCCIMSPAITNQVLSSWLLTTSPRSSASSRRFCVGSSVLSEVSFSSAIDRYPPFATFQALFERRHVVHHADEVVEEGSHHRREHGGENQEACEDRQRRADEIDLHLRHQPRQHAKPDIEDQAEYQEGRRELQADLEGGGEGARGERGDIAACHRLARRKDRVAVVQRRDDE